MTSSTPPRLLAAAAVALALLAAPALAAGPDADRYIVKFKDSAFGAGSEGKVKGHGGRVHLKLDKQKAVAATLNAQALGRLRQDPDVEYVEVDAPRFPMAQSTPYGITMVQADQVSDIAAANRTVCIIDSGYSIDHEDLQNTNVSGTDNVGTGHWHEDTCGHGSHVAGTIAALNNAAGVVGVLPNGNINLHIVKVFNGADCAWTYTSTLVNALNTCRGAGANVVSMSLGGAGSSVTEQNAFNDAWAAGVLSIAAAGNGGNTAFSYPASYPSVVSVAAIDSNKVVADFSQKNSQVDVAAPGVGVLSSVPWLETDTLSAGGSTWSGGWVDGAARTGGTTGPLADGGQCTTNGGGAWAGKVVLCQRGTVTFADKINNVQAGGGVAAVVYNNASSDPTCADFSGTLGGTSIIPGITLSCQEGSAALGLVGTSGTVVSQRDEPASGYEAWGGTSMATPHVAGVAALVWSHDPTWTNSEIRTALEASAQDLGATGRDNEYGHGLVQAKAALDHLQTADTTAPVITSIGSTRLKGNKFEIGWTTNEPANSEVVFVSGATGTFTDVALVTSHGMTFRGSRGVLYQYYVASTDAAGNRSQSTVRSHQN